MCNRKNPISKSKNKKINELQELLKIVYILNRTFNLNKIDALIE